MIWVSIQTPPKYDGVYYVRSPQGVFKCQYYAEGGFPSSLGVTHWAIKE